jgi:hypothetical protein
MRAATKLRWLELLSSLPEPPEVDPGTPSARLHEVLFPALVRTIGERPMLRRLYPVAQRYSIGLRRTPDEVNELATAAVSIPHCFGGGRGGGPYWLFDRLGGELLAEGELETIIDLLERRVAGILAGSGGS